MRNFICSAFLTLLIFVSGCGSLAKEIEQEDLESARITTQIKADLVASNEIDAAAVLVKIIEDELILSGFVATDEEANTIVRIATESAAGYVVKNELVVK